MMPHNYALAGDEPPPPPPPLPDGDETINVLVRGQSNALLFVDYGGAYEMELALEAQLGHDVRILAEWGTDTSTIHSGTAFMSWDTDGQQASLLRYIDNLATGVKDDPTITLWMHNEYDQGNLELTTPEWVGEVETDAALVRAALGQDASTTPYLFVPIRYGFGNNFEAIGDGMAQLSANASFNAEVTYVATGPEVEMPGGSHMDREDASYIGNALDDVLLPMALELVDGTPPPPPVGVVINGTKADNTLNGGAGNDTISGRGGGDVLSGFGGNDALFGDKGVDTLTGGAGADDFGFTIVRGAKDIITDFGAGNFIVFSALGFGGGIGEGFLSANEFAANNTGRATMANAQFIYEIDVGKLWFDVDGTGAEGRSLIATLSSAPIIEAGNIWGRA